MAKSSNELTLGEAIRELLKTYRLENKLAEVKLINSWEGIVGRMIARHTKDIRVKNRILYIKMDSAALTNELKYSKSKLKDALNQAAGENLIDEIYFSS